MNLAFEIVLGVGALYALFLFQGWGAARFLIPEDGLKRFALAPWIGIAFSGVQLIFAGLAGWGTDRSLWPILGSSFALMVLSYAKVRAARPRIQQVIFAAGSVALLSGLILFLTLGKSKVLTSFTIGNRDLYDYVMTARHLQTDGLTPYVRQLFGRQPEDPNASMRERIASWQIPSLRWASYYELAFACSFFGRDPAQIYSVFLVLLYALFLPPLWLLARALNIRASAGAFALSLCAFNPHILYIVCNGFLPQIAGTGFLIAFAICFEAYAKGKMFLWREFLSAALLAAGVLASYPELFFSVPFLAGSYLFWLARRGLLNYRAAGTRLLALLAMVAALCPLHAWRYISVMLFHAGDQGGGWNVTDRYYFLVFPLGGFFSHPHFPHPAPLLEWTLAPLLLFVIVRGFRQIQDPAFFLLFASPFVLTGAASYAHDWNYRFYKNFTYIYFWLPIAVAAGLQSLWPDMKISGSLFPRKALAGIGWASVLFLWVAAASKSFESLLLTARNGDRIPVSWAALEAVNGDPSIRRIFIAGLSDWESLWAAYYLRDKNLLFAGPVVYLRNDLASLDDLKSLDLLARSDDSEAAAAAQFFRMEKAHAFGNLSIYRHRSEPS